MGGDVAVAVSAPELKAKALEVFLQALAVTGGPIAVSCEHREVEFVRGDLVHCKCGLAFRVKCQHIEVEQVLPRVWRCCDCREWRGAGEDA
jgi:hypothetical protein